MRKLIHPAWERMIGGRRRFKDGSWSLSWVGHELASRHGRILLWPDTARARGRAPVVFTCYLPERWLILRQNLGTHCYLLWWSGDDHFPWLVIQLRTATRLAGPHWIPPKVAVKGGCLVDVHRHWSWSFSCSAIWKVDNDFNVSRKRPTEVNWLSTFQLAACSRELQCNLTCTYMVQVVCIQPWKWTVWSDRRVTIITIIHILPNS